MSDAVTDPLRRLARPGVGTVSTSSRGPLGPASARACGLRRGHDRVAFEVTAGEPERWTRQFGRRRRSTLAWVDARGDLIERIGPFTLRFSIRTSGSRTIAELRRIGVGRHSVPSGSMLVVTCTTRSDLDRSDRWSTTVRASIGGRRWSLGGFTYTATLEAIA